MKANSRRRIGATARDGSALVIVMCLAGLLLMVGLSLSFITGSSAHTVRKLTTGVQALAVAEAGVADMLSRLQTNYVQWMAASNSASFGGGTYSVVTTYNSGNGNITITSTGQIGEETRTTVLELLGEKYQMYNQALGLDGVMLAGGNITIDTGAIDINGDIHANGNILHSHGNTSINGDASACGVVELDAVAGYTNIPNATPVALPDYRPFDEWEALAISNGLYYATGQAFGGVNLAPPNGVLYVNGNVSFGNNSSLVGTLVAAGDITFVNRFTHTSFNTNWPALLATGNISLHNRDNYYGVIFAGGNFSSRNAKHITGAIIAMGNITAENNFNIDPLGYYPAWDPSDTNQTPPDVVVGGWLK